MRTKSRKATCNRVSAASAEAMVRSIGPRIRAAREGRGLTTADVARALRTSTSYILRLETSHDRCTLKRLYLFSQLFGVSVTSLLGGAA